MTMNPYLSWALLLVVAGSLGWYYTNGSAPKATKTPVRAVVEKAEATVAPKKQKRKPVPQPAKKSEVKTVISPPTSEEEEQAEDDVDRKEMARRLAAIKNGTSPATAPSTKNQKKKAKKANQLESGSHASSTTGADADDDLSPAVSPQVNAVRSAGYVSDMLEAPAPAASVLRVTGNVESAPKKEKVQSFKQVENKKQRQQRLKNETRKEQVREAEEQRRQLLEKQLHTARESERREAARSQAPATNAWQTKEAPKANGTKAVPAPAPTSAPVQLLDTFESAPTQKKWAQELPSEEEQVRILGAANGVDEWTTVSKKPKKKGTKADESVSDASASESQAAPAAPLPVEPKVTVTPTYLPDILRSTEKGHPLDSDWAA
ncbi:hypothetical protein N7466_011216 [Penicillium verhagenii]|uniref:uncharacterized protein n=1 Tax=Penicillium verhagenii TaxID=1562060 RepID=UPI002544D50C|nr:uncharacterized protein N7466_011216 [Penicillium verhagenii]KAJ5917662.1 hypothetical protein N7466_011216 [Penicillium verhagenii]